MSETTPEFAAPEVAAATTPPTTPPSWAPSLVPLASLTRRQRADFFEKTRNLPVNEAGEFAVSSDMSGYATVMALFADIEDALVLVAIGAKDQVRKVFADASDDDLMDLFNWYMGQMEPGEAQSSAN